MDFVKRLQQIMQEQNLSQYRLGQLSGMSTSTIGNILNGTSPSVHTVTQLCDGLGLTLSQFFRRPGNRNPLPR